MLLITCPYGLSSILNNDIKKLWHKSFDTFDTWTFVDGWLAQATHINLSSRIANKVYLRTHEPSLCTNFDDLFDLTTSIDRSQYISKGHGVSIKVHLRQSIIDSASSSQSIIHKAIMTSLTWSKEATWDIDPDLKAQSLFVVINKNVCTIYINTSGDSLHNRWYKDATGDAPLKENLAAALIQLANRKYSEPLIDPCCGSWTLCIEAAMLAKNVAPGLDRYFAFEQFPCFDKPSFEVLREKAESSIYSKPYPIFWYDIDPEMIEIAKKNAKNAGVEEAITFEAHDILDTEPSYPNNATIVSNPPYWIRLPWDSLDKIHEEFAQKISKKTVIITGYPGAKKYFPYLARSNKNTKNGSEEVKIYLSK